jgi:hypothetical protein
MTTEELVESKGKRKEWSEIGRSSLGESVACPSLVDRVSSKSQRLPPSQGERSWLEGNGDRGDTSRGRCERQSVEGWRGEST